MILTEVERAILLVKSALLKFYHMFTLHVISFYLHVISFALHVITFQCMCLIYLKFDRFNGHSCLS